MLFHCAISCTSVIIWQFESTVFFCCLNWTDHHSMANVQNHHFFSLSPLLHGFRQSQDYSCRYCIQFVELKSIKLIQCASSSSDCMFGVFLFICPFGIRETHFAHFLLLIVHINFYYRFICYCVTLIIHLFIVRFRGWECVG